jgi:orotate phosphoribosyltransferase
MKENLRAVTEAVAQAFLSTGAVTVDAEHGFEFVSGLHSPIYVDSRRLISFPKERRVILGALENLIQANYATTSAVAGIVTAGVPWAAWIAADFDLPLLYVRPEAKPRGLGRQVEGALSEGAQVLLIEDLITTGLSTVRCANAIRNGEAAVLGALSIFSYEVPFGEHRLNQAGVNYSSLLPFSSFLEASKSYFTMQEMEALRDWQTRVLPNFMPRE